MEKFIDRLAEGATTRQLRIVANAIRNAGFGHEAAKEFQIEAMNQGLYDDLLALIQ